MVKNILKISTFVFLFTLLIPLHSFANQDNILSQMPTDEEIERQMEETKKLMDENFKKAEEEVLDTDEKNQLFDEEIDEFDNQKEEVQDDIDDISRTIKSVPTKDLEKGIAGILGSFSLLLLVLVFFSLFTIAGIVLNIVMIIDCKKREFKDKTLWLVILIVGTLMGFGIIPGLLYYFLVKQKLGPIEEQETKTK